MSSSGEAGRAEGRYDGEKAANSLTNAGKGIVGGTERLREGINSFFDNTLQPGAKRDADAGVTDRHRATHSTTVTGSTSTTSHYAHGQDRDADMLSTGTAPTSTARSSAPSESDSHATGAPVTGVVGSTGSQVGSAPVTEADASSVYGSTSQPAGTTATATGGASHGSSYSGDAKKLGEWVGNHLHSHK